MKCLSGIDCSPDTKESNCSALKDMGKKEDGEDVAVAPESLLVV